MRARQWPAFRRLLYLCGAPLIPMIRSWRIPRHILVAGGHQDLLPGVIPVLSPDLIISGIGEMAGYASEPEWWEAVRLILDQLG